MAPTFAEGPLRVTTQSSHHIGSATVRAERVLPASTEALIAALADSGLDLVGAVDLVPRRPQAGGPKPGSTASVSDRTAPVRVELDLARSDDGVVLLECDGVYSWHFPVHPTAEPGSAADRRTVAFEIDVQAKSASDPRLPAQEASRSASALRSAARALVFRFAVPAALENGIATLEEHVQPGLLHLTDADVGAWRRFETLDQLRLPTDRPVRVLLFVHGTFSSTVGTFGALAIDENGREFLRTAISAYDAVIGFDHRTLSLDPRQNAMELLERFRHHSPGTELAIDVVAHGRGGLVARSLAEEVLPGGGWLGGVDIAIFVAATNAGTRLAESARWHETLDLYTNLASIAARDLAELAARVPLAAVVRGAMSGVGPFVKYLALCAPTDGDVPGLAALVPGGAYVTELNLPLLEDAESLAEWFVVTSKFHGEVFEDHRLAELPHDLVSDICDLGDSDRVHHTDYFHQPFVIKAMSGWLPLGLGPDGRDGPDGAGLVSAASGPATSTDAVPQALAR
jgi:hypothetical protein